MVKLVKMGIEFVGWLAIAGGTTLGAALVSLVIYNLSRNFFIATTIIVTGFVIGAIWATRISMKHGTMEWLSQIRRIS